MVPWNDYFSVFEESKKGNLVMIRDRVFVDNKKLPGDLGAFLMI